jgi:hypothetical protein
MFEPHAKRGIILDAKVAKDVEPTLSPLSGVYQMFSCHRISYSYKISTAGCPFPWVWHVPMDSHGFPHIHACPTWRNDSDKEKVLQSALVSLNVSHPRHGVPPPCIGLALTTAMNKSSCADAVRGVQWVMLFWDVVRVVRFCWIFMIFMFVRIRQPLMHWHAQHCMSCCITDDWQEYNRTAKQVGELDLFQIG